MAEVDVTEVNRDLFSLARPVAEPVNFGGHHVLHHLSGWYMDGRRAFFKGRLVQKRAVRSKWRFSCKQAGAPKEDRP